MNLDPGEVTLDLYSLAAGGFHASRPPALRPRA
jgi:hypothetical protein